MKIGPDGYPEDKVCIWCGALFTPAADGHEICYCCHDEAYDYDSGKCFLSPEDEVRLKADYERIYPS